MRIRFNLRSNGENIDEMLVKIAEEYDLNASVSISSLADDNFTIKLQGEEEQIMSFFSEEFNVKDIEWDFYDSVIIK